MATPDMKAPLGSGGRFAAMTQKLEGQGKSPESAKAVSASIGRAKYGNAKMNMMSRIGRNRAERRG